VSVSNVGSEPLPRQRGVGALRWLGRGINLPLLIGAAAFAAYASGAGPYDLRLISIAGIYAILVIGFQFVFGYAGAISLAQSCFFGLGAYITGVLGARYGLEATITFPLSIVGPALLAALVAYTVLRLEDQYFALATLSISLLVQLVVTQWQTVTGGTNGLSGIPGITLFGWTIASRWGTMVAVWVLVVVAGVLAFQITRGLYGRAFHLMRESLPVASALGLDVARMRFAAFVLSAGYAGAAGSLIAHVVHVVSPEQVGLPLMITCLTMTVIGGRLSVAGAVLGAVAIVYLQEQFRSLQNYTLIAYGGVTLAFVIAAPYGLIGALERLRGMITAPRRGAVPTAQPIPRPAAMTRPQGPALLSVVGVVKSFGGVRALDDVSLSLQPSEIVGLIGPNGSGKTTLLNVISGLYESDAGRLEFLGQDATRLPAFRIARLGMARTFQHIHLVEDMSVVDNIALGRATAEGVGLKNAIAAFHRDDGLDRARGIAISAARMLGVEQHATTLCGGLAYGTRRRVEVARAIAAAPQLLLLDEPAAGLNEEEQRDLAARIRSIAALGVAVLVVEHNLVFLGALAERLVCLDQGRLIADDTPDAVRSHPKVVEAYLGAPA